MSRSERLLLLVFFAAVLVVLSRRELTSTAVGAALVQVLRGSTRGTGRDTHEA